MAQRPRQCRTLVERGTVNSSGDFEDWSIPSPGPLTFTFYSRHSGADGKRVVTWCTLQGSTNDYYSFEYVDARPEAGRDGAYSVLKNYGIDY